MELVGPAWTALEGIDDWWTELDRDWKSVLAGAVFASIIVAFDVPVPS